MIRGGGGREAGEVMKHTQIVSGLWSNLIHRCHFEENLSVAMWRPDTGSPGTFVFVRFIGENSQIIALCLYTCMCGVWREKVSEMCFFSFAHHSQDYDWRIDPEPFKNMSRSYFTTKPTEKYIHI